MIFYASIDRIEGKVVICEVEKIYFFNSKSEDFSEKDTTMINVPYEIFDKMVYTYVPHEGDILVLIHDGQTVTEVLYQDKLEEQKRKELLKSLTDF